MVTPGQTANSRITYVVVPRTRLPVAESLQLLFIALYSVVYFSRAQHASFVSVRQSVNGLNITWGDGADNVTEGKIGSCQILYKMSGQTKYMRNVSMEALTS